MALFMIITVDTEDSQSLAVIYNDGIKEIDSMIYGYLNDQYYGFPKIIDICDKHNCKATFFISVFEYRKYGNSTIMKICQQIKQSQHDVQLHIHPARAYNKDAVNINEYSLEEQIQMIKDGKELIEKWIGEKPVAHRAGAYGINEDTFTALKENDIGIDSSSFYGYENCKAVVTKNKVVEHNSIIEVPVTVFQRNKQIKFLNSVLWQKLSIIKTDIDWASLDELNWFVRQAKEHDIKVMNLFMHSYSLLKFDHTFSHFEPDWNDIEKLDKFLNFVANDPDIKVITMKEFYKLYQENPDQFIGSDYVPVIEYPEKFRPIKHFFGLVRSLRKRHWG